LIDGLAGIGIELTGCPDLYGVFIVDTEASVSGDIEIR
jgi:hypothetical protein